jgi:hypothetical protein
MVFLMWLQEHPGAMAYAPGDFWAGAFHGEMLSLHAEAFAFDDDGLGVMLQPVEDGGGER